VKAPQHGPRNPSARLAAKTDMCFFAILLFRFPLSGPSLEERSRPYRTEPRSEPVADERARRSPQEEHAGDVVDCVHGLTLLA